MKPMKNEKDFAAWKAERNRVLRELDLDTPALSVLEPHVALIALHKARYECLDIEDDLRRVSGEWLKAYGYGRLGNIPFEPDGKLPT